MLLLETHDQPVYLRALKPVIADTCNVLAALASTKPGVFADALEPLTDLARQLAEQNNQAASSFFAALADDEEMAAEGQVLLCLLTATATQGCRSSEATDRLAKRLAAAVERSSIAPVAARALGDSFGAVDCHLLGSLAFKVKARKRLPDASKELLPTRYNEFVRLKQDPDCSGGPPLHRAALIALVRLDVAGASRRSVSSKLCSPAPSSSAVLDVSIALKRYALDLSLACTVTLHDAGSSAAPGLCLLPIANGAAAAPSTTTLVEHLLKTPAADWQHAINTWSPRWEGAFAALPSAFRLTPGHPASVSLVPELPVQPPSQVQTCLVLVSVSAGTSHQ